MRRLPVSYNDVLYVVQRMREADRREIYATRWANDPVAVATDVMSSGPFGWVCGIDRPIAAIGALSMWPGVWSVWMFATDEFRKIGLPMTRFVKNDMIPAVASTGAHRAECKSLADHFEAHAWLELLGARREYPEPHRGYGRGGEDFYTYIWTRDHVLSS